MRCLCPAPSLTGTLAETIGTTSFLTNLYLGGNELRGTIPAGMTTSSQLTNVDLSNNAWIVGPIPSFRWGCLESARVCVAWGGGS